MRVLPPGLLSRTIAAFETLQESSIDEPFGNLDFLKLLAIVFDLCRNVLGGRKTGKIEVYEGDRTRSFLLLYDNLALNPQLDNAIVQSIKLRHISGFDQISKPVECWKNLRRTITAHLETSPSRRLDSVEPLVAAALSVVKNCPYSPSPAANCIRKWRNGVVTLVCNPENSETIRQLALELQRRPRLLKLAGWCGGTVLHPCCRLGNLGQLRLLLDAVHDQRVQTKIGIQSAELINWRNVDGCTPLYIANFYGQKSAATMMLEAGADPTITDRFTTGELGKTHRRALCAQVY